jgi:ketosteroid isomerase-like protein
MNQLRTRRRLLAEAAAGILVATSGQAAANEAPEAGVKSVIDAFFAAARRHDWDATGRMMAENFRIWVDGDESMDRDAYLVVLKEDDMEVVDIKLDDLDIGVSKDGSMAWSRYRATVDSITKGKRSSERTAETILFDRVKDQWMMRHIHVSLVRKA